MSPYLVSEADGQQFLVPDVIITLGGGEAMREEGTGVKHQSTIAGTALLQLRCPRHWPPPRIEIQVWMHEAVENSSFKRTNTISAWRRWRLDEGEQTQSGGVLPWLCADNLLRRDAYGQAPQKTRGMRSSWVGWDKWRWSGLRNGKRRSKGLLSKSIVSSYG